MSGFRCTICGKKRVVGRQVSHSGARTPRTFKPNLQWKHVMLGGKTVRIRICTRCLKRLKKEATTPAKATVEKQVSEAPVTSQ